MRLPHSLQVKVTNYIKNSGKERGSRWKGAIERQMERAVERRWREELEGTTPLASAVKSEHTTTLATSMTLHIILPTRARLS